MCAVGRTERGGRNNDKDFIIRNYNDGERKADRERNRSGEQSNNDLPNNNADHSGNHYNNERDHSANVSNETDESGYCAANQKQACVGATGACQGDYSDDND